MCRTQAGMSNVIQSRQPKGIPVGGQFSTYAHPESGITLHSAQNLQAMAERRELLKASGFIPATTLQAANAPTTTEHRSEWWDRNMVAAEYRTGKAYPQMPDDFTPAKTLGHAMSGHRRTHRMNYGNGDIQLRMPSATAIKRFSKENGSPTFDVPISVSLKGAAPVQGWVRVTQTGPNTWETTALGGGGDSAAQISEAVTSVLESRRPSSALVGVADLLEAHRARKAAQGTELAPLTSKFIDSVGYDEATGTMATRIGAKLYGHRVPKALFDKVKDSDRPGALFNQLIKPSIGAGVSQCGTCGRAHVVNVRHTCPKGHKTESGISPEYTAAARRRAEHAASVRSRGIDPAVGRNVAPPPPPVNTKPHPDAQPVPPRGTGRPGPRRDLPLIGN